MARGGDLEAAAAAEAQRWQARVTWLWRAYLWAFGALGAALVLAVPLAPGAVACLAAGLAAWALPLAALLLFAAAGARRAPPREGARA